MITIDNIRARLIECIRSSGINQTTLARQLGVCRQTIGQYLGGYAMPALDTLANLCLVLDEDANYILCQDVLPNGPEQLRHETNGIKTFNEEEVEIISVLRSLNAQDKKYLMTTLKMLKDKQNS